jgi:hypothetical protein
LAAKKQQFCPASPSQEKPKDYPNSKKEKASTFPMDAFVISKCRTSLDGIILINLSFNKPH